jgi:hypothetical protein
MNNNKQSATKIIRDCGKCMHFNKNNKTCENPKYLIKYKTYPVELIKHNKLPEGLYYPELAYNIRSDFTKCGINARDFKENSDVNVANVAIFTSVIIGLCIFLGNVEI